MGKRPAVEEADKVGSTVRRLATFSTLRTTTVLLTLGLLSGTGCIVSQPPGKGRSLHLTEPRTGARYWLYLPEGYCDRPVADDPNSRHPLVMTFHGMRPFDNDKRQIREWQQEADRYGFVVCAPHLRVSALLSPLPLKRADNARLKHDERNIIAIMDELYRTVNVDPNRVLSTSWSCGGYVAHYIANRHPERFSCVSVRQSNFSPDILDPANVGRYRNCKVGIFYTEHDFAICKQESRAAAQWYARNGFDVTYGVTEGKGHVRTPGVAAEFFARAIGAEPRTPPERASIRVVAIPMYPEKAISTPLSPAAPPARATRTSAGSAPALPDAADRGPLRLRVSATIGVTPLLVSYSAALPGDLRRGASALWIENGEPFSSGLTGQKVFTKPGEHRLEALVTTADGKEYRAARTITVIERASRRRR